MPLCSALLRSHLGSCTQGVGRGQPSASSSRKGPTTTSTLPRAPSPCATTSLRTRTAKPDNQNAISSSTISFLATRLHRVHLLLVFSPPGGRPATQDKEQPAFRPCRMLTATGTAHPWGGTAVGRGSPPQTLHSFPQTQQGPAALVYEAVSPGVQK